MALEAIQSSQVSIRNFINCPENLLPSKGLDTGEFLLEDVKCEKGNFSWGGSVERKYFIVGPHAKVTGNPKVKEYFKRKARRKRK